MGHKKLLVVLSIFLSASCFSQTYIPPGPVSGTWGTGGTPFYIQGDITIPDDSTLIIEPGVSVVFEDYYALNVQGRLLAVGTASDMISFTVDDTTGFYDPDITSGGWNGIQFNNTPTDNDTSKIVFCSLQYGKAVDTTQPDNSGGAISILNFSKVIISNCSISYNSAGGLNSPSGGGLYLFYADIILTGNEISHNSALGGGGILIWESDVIFTGNSIKYNIADQSGGGIWIGGESNVHFNSDTISNNSVGYSGGGIVCWQTTNTTLNSVVVKNNTADWGGGIGVYSCSLQIDSSVFTGNGSTGIAGGLGAEHSSVIINNTSFERDTAFIFGGAMGINNSDLNINNSNLTDNSSRVLGGGIHSDYSTINIYNTIFERDTVGGNPEGSTGGGIYLWHSDLMIDNCEFINDSAYSSGGAVGSDSSSITINNTEFIQNSSTDNGGAIAFNNGSIDISNSNFSQNSAVWGGGIISYRGDISIQNCTFTENSSEHGGAISIGLGNLEIKEVSFEQNSSIWGGGISTTNCNLSIDSCLFSQNTVTSEAGAIECIIDTAGFIEELSIQITNSGFLNNTSDDLFAGVKIRQFNSDTSLCNVVMDNNVFKDNSALSYTAVRFIGNIDDINVNNSIFENNKNTNTTQFTSVFSANGGAKVKVNNTVFAKNYPRAASLNINSVIDFMNCTFVNNFGTSSAALSLRNNAEAKLTNSILWNNGNNIIMMVTVGGNGNTLTVNYSDLQYDPDSISVSDSVSIVNWGTGNIDSEPLFVDTLNSDFHLQDVSPCIAAGIDSIEIAGLWYYCPTTDIEGNPRPNPDGTMPDMGAYESQYPVRVSNQDPGLPTEYALYPNYPNPFNPATTISYNVPVKSYISLRVFNALGREVLSLVDKEQAAGVYQVKLNAVNLASGVYFYQLKALPIERQSGEFIQTRKMIFIK